MKNVNIGTYIKKKKNNYLLAKGKSKTFDHFMHFYTEFASAPHIFLLPTYRL